MSEAVPPSIARIPAIVTAGGPVGGDLAAQAGTDLKALLPIGGEPLLVHVLQALRHAPGVGSITVIGPKSRIETVARDAGAERVIEAGRDGDENLMIGLEALSAARGADSAPGQPVLFAASDLPFLDTEATTEFLNAATGKDADIVYPILTRQRFAAAFPDVPKTYARLADGEMTGGSVLLLNPDALLRNRNLIGEVFQARKNELAMAKLLGFAFAVRYKMGKLTVADAVRRASELTGCSCAVLSDADPRLAYDIDDTTDYNDAVRRWENARTFHSVQSGGENT
ncbi:MAG: nucleotidyltransferase family protein [Armatimonadaceae bacterium]